jgi:hypothetical protein
MKPQKSRILKSRFPDGTGTTIRDGLLALEGPDLRQAITGCDDYVEKPHSKESGNLSFFGNNKG